MERKAEQALFDRLLHRDAQALEALVRVYQPELFRFVLRLVRETNDAQDILQDTFVRVWEKARTYKGESSLKTWIFRIAMNLSYTHLKRNRRWETLDVLRQRSDHRNPAEEAEMTFRQDRLADALKTLTPRQHAVVMARIYGDLPFDEIGRAIGCSTNAAKVHFHDGKQRLQTYFTEKVGIHNERV